MATVIDWDAIGAEYISGKETLKELAKRHNVTYNKLCVHSKQGGWPQRRAEYRAEVAAMAVEQTALKDADELSGCLDSSRIMRDIVLKCLQDPEQLFTYFVNEVQDGDSFYRDVKSAKLDTRALREMSGTIETLTKLFMTILRIPTLRDERELEKLKLDKARDAREAAREAEDNSKTIRVVMSPEVEAILPDE